jgi:DNA helicase II / ATP-dependent DNA helicase PcrA
MTPTAEQRAFAEHPDEAAVEACPGAGKTRTILTRLANLGMTLPPRRGLAVLSFTNKAIEEFLSRASELGITHLLRHPGFIGTFDAFVRHFLFSPAGTDAGTKPHVVDSWDSLGVEIRLRGADAFRGPGISLDLFDPHTNTIDPGQVPPMLRSHVTTHRRQYERSAQAQRDGLKRSGYFSAADARLIALERLRRADWGQPLGRALASRFQEIIVDEAQDCNGDDLEILEWLRRAGLRVTVVYDRDQSIYGFRSGEPAELDRFAGTYRAANRLPMTGNFRSSPAICALAASLRRNAVSDIALGKARTSTVPIAICPYPGRSVSGAIGQWFLAHAASEISGLAPSDVVVLAHSHHVARVASGSAAVRDAGESKVERLARAVGEFWAGTTKRGKANALAALEQVLLDVAGQRADRESVPHAVERLGLNSRVLRRQALELAMRLPNSCRDSDDARTAWVNTARTLIRQMGVRPPGGQSLRSQLRQPATASWARAIEETATNCGLSFATIHSAKGGEYQGVCVVIPPDDTRRLTTELFTAWENRTDTESKRVAYVGVTRAVRFAALAVPAAFLDRCVAILRDGNVPHSVHPLLRP